MSKPAVKYQIDPANPPPLTQQQKKELKVLSAVRDSEIDTKDLPPLDADFWKSAVRNPFYKPTKQATTVRVDSDVLLWLKSKGKGYQTRINRILRDAMLREIDES
jgi:uncharacterized protein (DUF4415 family)